MLNRSLAVFLIGAFAFTALSFAKTHEKIHQPKLTPQDSGTTQGLIAVSPVDSRVVWASGRGGTFLLTTNGGETWKAAVVPGAGTSPSAMRRGSTSSVMRLPGGGPYVG